MELLFPIRLPLPDPSPTGPSITVLSMIVRNASIPILSCQQLSGLNAQEEEREKEGGEREGGEKGSREEKR